MIRQYYSQRMRRVQLGLWAAVFHYSGAKAIWQRISPPAPDELKAPTIVLWIITLHIALFNIASNRYENRLQSQWQIVNSPVAPTSKLLRQRTWRITTRLVALPFCVWFPRDYS